MIIDLISMNKNISKLDIHGEVLIPNEYLKNSSIVSLKNVFIDGILEKIEDNITLNATISGIMVIEDSISLELVEYPFSSDIEEEIEEIDRNYSNTLDITDILWQNIMLEVPLKFTEVENFNEYQGDGWKLVDEDSIKSTNNPFNELKDMMGEE